MELMYAIAVQEMEAHRQRGMQAEAYRDYLRVQALCVRACWCVGWVWVGMSVWGI